MGKKADEPIRPDNDEVKRPAGTAGKSKDSADTTAGTAGGTAGGSAGGSTGTEEKETVISRLSDVEKKEERNRKRREAYKAKKEAEGGSVKPRKVSTRKKKEVAPTLDTAILIGTISTMVASRPGLAHWQLTPDEIKSIADPLNNLLKENEAFAALNEHSDAVALLMASLVIAAPRILLTIQMKGAKKHERNSGNPESKQAAADTGTSDTSASGSSKKERANSATGVSVNTNDLGSAIAY